MFKKISILVLILSWSIPVLPSENASQSDQDILNWVKEENLPLIIMATGTSTGVFLTWFGHQAFHKSVRRRLVEQARYAKICRNMGVVISVAFLGSYLALKFGEWFEEGHRTEVLGENLREQLLLLKMKRLAMEGAPQNPYLMADYLRERMAYEQMSLEILPWVDHPHRFSLYDAVESDLLETETSYTSVYESIYGLSDNQKMDYLNQRENIPTGDLRGQMDQFQDFISQFSR